MPPSDPSTKNSDLTQGPARKRREERRVQGSTPFAGPMAQPRRKLGSDSVNPPPAVSRQAVGGMATPRRSTGRRSQADSWVGRRYDIALPGTGAEMRLPALPIIQGDWRFLSGVLVAVFALLTYFFVFSPIFQVEVVDIRGPQRISKADINLVLDVAGKPVIAISPTQLEERLLAAFPDLSIVQAKVILPAKIVITATERQPVLVWQQGNTERWVDAEGVIFPIRGSLAVEASESVTQTAPTLVTLQADNLPFVIDPAVASTESIADQTSLLAAIAMGANGPRQVDPALVSNILALSSILPANTALVYTDDHGLGWRDPGGWEVYFGSSWGADSSVELAQKQLVYQEITKYLAAKGITPALVSVANVHAPYYRMER